VSQKVISKYDFYILLCWLYCTLCVMVSALDAWRYVENKGEYVGKSGMGGEEHGLD
jgi:hypothetical protein